VLFISVCISNVATVQKKLSKVTFVTKSYSLLSMWSLAYELFSVICIQFHIPSCYHSGVDCALRLLSVIFCWSFCDVFCTLQEVVSLNIDGHQVQLLPSGQQNVLNIDPSQADFIQLPYSASDQFQQQLTAVQFVEQSRSVCRRYF